ncbi:MAG: riboflavin synthase [Beijerinckiaceae bacterium]
MFTGLVSDVGRIVSAEGDRAMLRRFVIDCGYDAASILIGASIACSGVCLTAVAVEPRADGGARLTLEAAAETLARTTVANWDAGQDINLERSLKVGDELGGHLVTGHVDGVCEVIEAQGLTMAESDWGATLRLVMRTEAAVSAFIAKKGSVCLDGVSLTVNHVKDNDFSVLLIPHTLSGTTLRHAKVGTKLNLEVDLLARYARRLLSAGAINLG